MSHPDLTQPMVEHWLSSGRLRIYQEAAKRDLDRALALYDWNARTTAACLQDIGHLEVLIRNRYDEQMRTIIQGTVSPKRANDETARPTATS